MTYHFKTLYLMKNIFTLILSFLPTLLFSQNWEFQEFGNSFDGFGKLAAVQITLENEEETMLGIVNNSGELNLTWGINEENGINKLSIIILIPNDINPQKVLMAFDDERINYLLNFSYSDNRIYISNAVTPDFKSFLTTLDIISFFKQKKNVHFRVMTNDSKNDYSFPLNGSTTAINKTFVCSAYKKANNWTDAAFELLYFTEIFSKVDNGEKNFISIAPNCVGYLEEKYGTYFFTQIASIESSQEEPFPNLILKNSQGINVAEITKEAYLKNYFHFSGNIKKGLDQKIIKDLDTIRLYYEAFENYTNLISANKISFEIFSNYKKHELQTYYNSILNNKELLDYLRLDNSIYYEYEAEEYTFDVFIEAWGN